MTVAADSPTSYLVYPERWFVLVTVCLLSLSNATIWIAYTPIPSATEEFYCRQNTSTNLTKPEICDVSYWTTQIFQIVGVLTGILGMYVTDKYGIKISVLVASTLNFFGALVRLFSTFSWVSQTSQLTLLYVGQTVAALAPSFFLCLSPKVAEYWFPENQRSVANALGFVANPFGVIIGSLTPTIIVGATDVDNALLVMNTMQAILATIVLIMSLLVRSGRPRSPPSASMENHSSPAFFEGLIVLFKTKYFYIQMVTCGFGFAIFFSLFFAGDQMFENLGYSGINGYGMALASMVGCGSSILAGVIVDRTKRFNEVVKGCYIGTAFSVFAITIFLRFQQHSTFNLVILYMLIATLSFFSTPTWPVGLELGVESTFPVAEATSSGVLITCCQLALFLLGYSMKGISKLDIATSSNNDFQVALDFWCVVSIVITIFTFFALNPQYRRLEFEEKNAAKKNAEMGRF